MAGREVEVILVVGVDGKVSSVIADKKIYDMKPRIPLEKFKKLCEFVTPEDDIVVKAKCNELVMLILNEKQEGEEK